MAVEDRVGALEALTGTLADEVRRLELRLGELEGTAAARASSRAPAAPPQRSAPPPLPAFAPPVAPAPATQRPASPAPAAARDATSLEDLLGGRALAWVGGLAVLVGIVLFLAMAVRNGWLGEGARTLLAAAGSLGLLATGTRLHASRTDAGLAAAAAGTAGLFATIAVATQHYALLAAAPGLLAAAATAAVATALAVRWSAPGIGALGLGGALLAPLLAGAGPDSGTVLFLPVAYAATVAVLVWQRWTWLAWLGFALVTPQWLWWAAGEPAASVQLVAATFGLLNTVAAVGYEVHRRGSDLPLGSQLLLLASAAVVAAAGAIFAGGDAAWLAAIAVVHLAAAAWAGRSLRASRELTLTLAAIGVVLADCAFAQVAEGLPLVVGWTLGAVGFAVLLHRWRHGGGGASGSGGGHRVADEVVARLGLGGHVALSVTSALAARDSAETATAPLLAVAVGCLVSARLEREDRAEWRAVLDALGVAAVALVLTDVLDGAALTAGLAAEALAVAVAGARMTRTRREGAQAETDAAGPADDGLASSTPAAPAGTAGPPAPGFSEPDPVATAGALALLATAIGHAVATLAMPSGLIDGVPALGAAAVGLLAVAAAAAACAEILGCHALASAGAAAGDLRLQLRATAGASILYLASLAVVTVSPADAAQLALSGLWATAGAGLLVAGLRRDLQELRTAGLALLALTAGKVFLYDLASLESIYRVASFIALGVVLLAGAHAWQRLRPRELD